MKAEAFLSVGRGRRKSTIASASGKPDQIFYHLKNGTEFELELFNGSQVTVGAKIEINGKPISFSYLVLRPGQRCFLERFLDTNERFKFNHYETEDSPEALVATKNNGLVKISFFDEQVMRSSGFTWTTTDLTYPDPTLGQWSNICNAVEDSIGYQHQDTFKFSGPIEPGTINCYASTPTTVTGRVESGSASSQQFTNANVEFNYFASTIVEFRILPETAISEIRAYCTASGLRRRKESWKFCPKCGTQL